MDSHFDFTFQSGFILISSEGVFLSLLDDFTFQSGFILMRNEFINTLFDKVFTFQSGFILMLYMTRKALLYLLTLHSNLVLF